MKTPEAALCRGRLRSRDATSPHLPALEELNLGSNPLGDLDAARLAGATAWPPLRDLHLFMTGLPAAGPLPASAHTTGLFVPGTTHHRALEVGDRAGGAVTETKAQIAEQHGVSEHSIQRANSDLNHREPRPGEWVVIPVH